MDICAIDETCGKDAVGECEVCGMFFCRQHGNREEGICVKCREAEESSGEDVELF